MYLYLTINNNMTTPNSKSVKETLKSKGVKVLRTLVYKGQLIVTVAAVNATLTESVLAELGIVQQFGPMNPSKPAKANLLGYSNAAEFTCLSQL